MSKKLRPKFWSLGTNLGCAEPQFQDSSHEMFSKYIFLIVWGPNITPITVAFLVGAKNLTDLSNWCVVILLLLIKKGHEVYLACAHVGNKYRCIGSVKNASHVNGKATALG